MKKLILGMICAFAALVQPALSAEQEGLPSLEERIQGGRRLVQSLRQGLNEETNPEKRKRITESIAFFSNALELLEGKRDHEPTSPSITRPPHPPREPEEER